VEIFKRLRRVLNTISARIWNVTFIENNEQVNERVQDIRKYDTYQSESEMNLNRGNKWCNDVLGQEKISFLRE
jgi:hypothetical protein